MSAGEEEVRTGMSSRRRQKSGGDKTAAARVAWTERGMSLPVEMGVAGARSGAGTTRAIAGWGMMAGDDQPAQCPATLPDQGCSSITYLEDILGSTNDVDVDE